MADRFLSSASLARVPLLACWLAVITELGVLISWITSISPFENFALSSVPMNPLTAVEFVLSGVCLGLLSGRNFRHRRNAIVLLSLSVTLLAVLKFCALHNLDSSLNRRIFQGVLDNRNLPSWMSPITALNFLFVGMSLFLGRTNRRYSEYLILPPFLISIIGVQGYLYSNAALARMGSVVPIPFHTTLLFLPLCLGILFLDGEKGLVGIFFQKYGGTIIARRMIPSVFLLPLVLGWIIVKTEQLGWLKPESGTCLLAVAGSLLGTAVLFFNTNVVNRLEEAIEKRNNEETERKISRLKRFFPQAIADQIASGEIDDPFKWHRNDITVIFIDIRGFTSYAELAEPEDVMSTLQDYYSTIAKIAQKHGGAVGHLAADGVMIFFNEPIPMENPQRAALKMALEIRCELNSLCQHWHKKDLNLHFGVGMASGFTTIGGIGTEGFWDYTVVGTAANVASRLCSAATSGQILISKTFLGFVTEELHIESVGLLNLKGIHHPVSAFNVVSFR
jgi:class 3 adenylate cyclase